MSSAPSEVDVFDTDFSASQPLSIRERVIVAPCSGRFKPLPPEVFTAEGEWVEAGQAVAEVLNGSDTATVRSAFSG